jgi:hypothetical protein
MALNVRSDQLAATVAALHQLPRCELALRAINDWCCADVAVNM